MTLNASPQVGLFVTCLVDLFRPSVAFAAIKLIEAGGARVEVPCAQTCCGQPAYNCGDRKSAIAIARQVVETFECFDYVVAPSGSCAGMLKLHYPRLLAGDPQFAERAENLGAKSFELTSFLTDVFGLKTVDAAFAGTVTYHDSCSALRELGVRDAPRRLLKTVRGLSLVELGESEVCCGFGGAFSVKYPEISTAILDAKTERHRRNRRPRRGVERSRLPHANRRKARARACTRRSAPCRRGARRHDGWPGDRRASGAR